MTDAKAAAASQAAPQLTLKEWLIERMNNSKRIAATRLNLDRASWLEDAEYYKRALDGLKLASEMNAAERALPASGQAAAPPVKMPVDGKCSYCGAQIQYSVAGEFCSNRECGYIDGHYWPREPKPPIKAVGQQGADAIMLSRSAVLDILDELTPEDAECDHPAAVAYQRVAALKGTSFAGDAASETGTGGKQP